MRAVRSWPVLLLAAPAGVSIWSGWVGLGGLTGFGKVRPLPGIWDSLQLDTAITLPIGVEAYAAFALGAWLTGRPVPARARRFARWSAVGSLVLAAAGQVAFHLMTAAGMTAAPWQITTLVSCLPVAVLGMGAALAHLLHAAEPVLEPVTQPSESSAGDGLGGVTEPVTVAPVVADGEPSSGGPDDTHGGGSGGGPNCVTQPVTQPARTAPRMAPATRQTTATKVAKVAAKMPGAPVAAVAKKAGVSESTARRYMPTPNGGQPVTTVTA